VASHRLVGAYSPDPRWCASPEDSVKEPVSHPRPRGDLRVLEECPEDMFELRATLLQEHVWRQREGLA
jgi:hypothetical protein